MIRRVGWWWALEPIATASVAWSLIRVDDDATPAGPVAAGLLGDLGELRLLVEGIPPRGSNRAELWSGPLADPDRESRTARRLGALLVPDALRTELLASDLATVRHTVSVACRGWLAQVPWELLALDDAGAVRLIERARVASALSPAINATRRRAPAPRPQAPALRVLDPGGRSDPEWPPIYAGYPVDWEGVVSVGEDLLPDGQPFTMDQLSDQLRTEPGWRRFLYLGHCRPGTAETPAGAALVLSRGSRSDLFTAHTWLSDPERWPCPPRVALIACGSDDAVHLEQSGLPVAAVNAGAELLTVTRWTLPLDVDPPYEAATTELALAVDSAHDHPDPLDAMARWQRDQLLRWRAGGGRSAAPMLWGSLATYVVPATRHRDLGSLDSQSPTAEREDS